MPSLFAATELGLWLEAEQVLALDQRSISSAQRGHTVLVIEDSYFSLVKEGTESCREICLQILFEGRYVPAVKHSDADLWSVFRLAHGEECVASPRSSRYLELLGRRYTDVCISVSDETPRRDALVIREHFSRESQIWQELPHRSGVRECLERLDNQDRVLTRWVTATLEGAGPWAVFWGLRERKVGAPFQDEEFYTAVLGIPIQKNLPRGNAPLSEILNELRPFFDDPKMVNWAMYAFERAMGQAAPEEAEQARQFLQARIVELKASPDPDPKRIEWFEHWLKRH